MKEKIQSGKDVIEEFISEIIEIEGTDKKTVDLIVSLHKSGRLTVTNLENALEEMTQSELDQITQEKDE